MEFGLKPPIADFLHHIYTNGNALVLARRTNIVTMSDPANHIRVHAIFQVISLPPWALRGISSSHSRTSRCYFIGKYPMFAMAWNAMVTLFIHGNHTVCCSSRHSPSRSTCSLDSFTSWIAVFYPLENASWIYCCLTMSLCPFVHII